MMTLHLEDITTIHIEDQKGYFINYKGQLVSFYQDQTKGFDKDLDGMDTVPGYLVECKDGHTYLLFGPDMDAVKNMHSYTKIFRNVKTYMSDHTYDPVRMCFRPAFVDEYDESGNALVLHAPASEMGKIYVLE